MGFNIVTKFTNFKNFGLLWNLFSNVIECFSKSEFNIKKVFIGLACYDKMFKKFYAQVFTALQQSDLVYISSSILLLQRSSTKNESCLKYIP